MILNSVVIVEKHSIGVKTMNDLPGYDSWRLATPEEDRPRRDGISCDDFPDYEDDEPIELDDDLEVVMR